MNDVVAWFAEGRCREASCAGGRGASLAACTVAGLPVPPGFVVTAWALEQAVDAAGLRALALAGDHAAAQALVRGAKPPRGAVDSAYRALGEGAVAVRSSACAEDSDTASYAGQQETFLNVHGAAEVRRRIVDCWASFFSERALFYRARKGSLDDLRMAVVVQQMVEPAKSGVLFTVDPVQRRRDRMVIEAIFGLGEEVVSGNETPDHYVIDRAGIVKRERLVHGGVLGPEELTLLPELGRAVEDPLRAPPGVEGGIAHGSSYLLP